MGLSSVEAVHDAGGRINEDVVSVGDSIAWVLDGATGLGGERLFAGEESDAALFVRRVDEELRSRADTPGSLARLVESALTAVADSLFAGAGEIEDRVRLPTAAIAMARAGAGRLDLFLLGDCRIVAHGPGDLLLDLRDGRHRGLDEIALHRLAEHLERGESFEASRAAIQDLLVEHRRLANQPGGYWILGNSPEAARHGVSVTLENPPEDLRLLLMTDGFSALLDHGLVPSTCHLMTLIEEHGLGRALELLRAEEDADPECRRHPRFKRKDDATAIYLRAQFQGG